MNKFKVFHYMAQPAFQIWSPTIPPHPHTPNVNCSLFWVCHESAHLCAFGNAICFAQNSFPSSITESFLNFLQGSAYQVPSFLMPSPTPPSLLLPLSSHGIGKERNSCYVSHHALWVFQERGLYLFHLVSMILVQPPIPCLLMEWIVVFYWINNYMGRMHLFKEAESHGKCKVLFFSFLWALPPETFPGELFILRFSFL